MKSLRLLLSVVSLLLLAAGYIGSQIAWFGNQAPEWARKVDTPPIVLLSLLILGLAIVLSLIPEREEER
jgi:hypothetical protein